MGWPGNYNKALRYGHPVLDGHFSLKNDSAYEQQLLNSYARRPMVMCPSKVRLLGQAPILPIESAGTPGFMPAEARLYDRFGLGVSSIESRVRKLGGFLGQSSEVGTVLSRM
jgi:hypothetical protein